MIKGVTYSEKGVQWVILHVFRHDHDRVTLGDNTFQVDDIRVIKLAHNAGLCQEVQPVFIGGSGFQGLNGHH